MGTNLDAVAHFLENFTVQALLPHLETRVRTLNAQVRNLSQLMTPVTYY